MHVTLAFTVLLCDSIVVVVVGFSHGERRDNICQTAAEMAENMLRKS